MERQARPWLFAAAVAGSIACPGFAHAQRLAQAPTGTPQTSAPVPRSEAEPTVDLGKQTSGDSIETSSEASAGPSRPPEQHREARERFDHGLELYRDGDYDIALIEFSRAYKLVPDYRVLYNIAQVSVMMGNYARARLTLEQYLEEGDAAISPDRRESVEKDLAMLNGRTATLLVTSNVVGAEVQVGEETIGKTPMSSPVLIDAGTHTVTVRLSGYLPASKRLTLAGRDTAEVAIELRPVPLKERERIVVEKRVEAGPSERATVTPSLVWAGWIATGALATGAAVTGVLGLNAASELETLQNDAEAQHRELEETEGRASSLFLAADLLGAAALLTGGAALYFTVFEPTPRTPPNHDRTSVKSAIGLSLSGVRVLGQF